MDALSIFIPGDGLFSHQVALKVSSALEALTTVFGMGTGVTPPQLATRKLTCPFGTLKTTQINDKSLKYLDYDQALDRLVPLS